MAKQGNSRRDQLNFNGGEISPLLFRRYDLDVFSRGCRQMQNMIPRKYGNAEKRNGTQYIASTKYGSGKSARLVTFSYSTDVVFFLEFGDRYIRFFTDGGIVMKNGVPYEIVSPYDEDTIGDIDWKEINDVVYITHPLIAPQKLARYADDNWTITPIEFDEPPFMALNVTDTTLTPSAEYGNCTLTASAPLFDQKHVGSYWKIGVKAASRKTRDSITVNGEKPFIRVKGRFRFSTCGTYAATIVLQRAYEAATPVWEDVYTYESAKDKNFETEIEQKDEIALWRAKIENFSGIEGDIPYVTLEAAEEYIYGTAKVLSVTSSTVASVFIYDRMYSSGEATKIWYEGAWSDYRGFPRSCCLFQQRMVYAGTTYQPQSVWGSVIGDYENFAYGTLDDDAFMHEIGSDERLFVMWMTAHNNSLLVGTSSAEYVLQGSNAGDDPVTPSNVQIKRQCSIGSARIRPIQAGGAVLHVQRDTEKLYELTYSLSTYGYDDNDITQFAEHIMRGGVKSMAFQRQPDPIVWVVRNDGVLLSCIYDASQKVVAWARHVTQGIVEDVVVGYGKTAGDEVWLVVTRTLGDGSKGRYIERIYPGAWETKDEGIFVDSALSNTMYEYASVAQTPPGGGGGGTGETDEQDDGGETGGGTDPYYPSEQPDPDNPWVPEDPSERNAPCPATQCRYKALNATLKGWTALHPSFAEYPPRKWKSLSFSGSLYVEKDYGINGSIDSSYRLTANGTATLDPITNAITPCVGQWTTTGASPGGPVNLDSACSNLGWGNTDVQYPFFASSAVAGYRRGCRWVSGVTDQCPLVVAGDPGESEWVYAASKMYSSGRVAVALGNEDTEQIAINRIGDTWSAPLGVGEKKTFYEQRTTGFSFAVRRCRLHGYTWTASIYGLPVKISIPLYKYALGGTKPATPTATQEFELPLVQLAETTTGEHGLTLTVYKGKATLPDWELPIEKGYVIEAGNISITLL